MMRMSKYYLLPALLLVALAASGFADSEDGEDITWQVLSGGSTEAEGGAFKLSGTLGELAVGYGEAAPDRIQHGYWQDFDLGGSGTCCTGPSVGNVDGSLDNLVTMGDLTVMIDHLFITLTPLACIDEGNVDLSADLLVTMGDLTVMIDHLFITLTPLPHCP